jgi:hypothetical protein
LPDNRARDYAHPSAWPISSSLSFTGLCGHNPSLKSEWRLWRGKMDGLFVPRHLIIWIVLLVLVLWPWSRIMKRMGFSSWVFIYYLAFGRWPRDSGIASPQ